jgi:hypothetical protein
MARDRPRTMNMFSVIVAYPTEEREKIQDGFAKPSKSDVR